MHTTRTTVTLLAALAAGVALAQNPVTTQDAAPIERQAAPAQAPLPRPMPRPQTAFTQVAPGVWVRSTPATHVETLSMTADKVELRIDRGVANLNVHHPDHRPQILVDLPGWQTAVLKDGLYTFNADTNTVRTLKGEAEAYSATQPNAKPVKVKEDHALSFTSAELKPYEFGPVDLRGDLLPGAVPRQEPGYGLYGGYGPYGDGFYAGDGPGYYGYPYGGYGPYWGEPYWGVGYPFGFGFGFGYYGGFGGFHRR